MGDRDGVRDVADHMIPRVLLLQIAPPVGLAVAAGVQQPSRKTASAHNAANCMPSTCRAPSSVDQARALDPRPS